jgi:hypothetical protein
MTHTCTGKKKKNQIVSVNVACVCVCRPSRGGGGTPLNNRPGAEAKVSKRLIGTRKKINKSASWRKIDILLHAAEQAVASGHGRVAAAHIEIEHTVRQ